MDVNVKDSVGNVDSPEMVSTVPTVGIHAGRELGSRGAVLSSSDKLPRGIRHGSGSAHRLDKSAIPIENASSSCVFLKGTVSHSKRVGQPAGKRGCDPSRLVRGTISQPYFLGSKKGSTFRPVFNLNGLNAFVRYKHFKMESTPMLMNLIQR